MNAQPHGERPDPHNYNFDGSPRVWMDRASWTRGLVEAIRKELPPETTIGFNYEGDKVWFKVSQPGDTTLVYQRALARLKATEQ